MSNFLQKSVSQRKISFHVMRQRNYRYKEGFFFGREQFKGTLRKVFLELQQRM